MKILYGIFNNTIDVTEICSSKLLNNNNMIIIPSGDNNRAIYFPDPIFGTLKKIFIMTDYDVTEYDDFYTIKIDITNNTITTINNNDVIYKMNDIHSKLTMKHGDLNFEIPEQRMAINYLTGNEKVLEIGGNIGRNSLVIAHILKQKGNNNLVTLECDVNFANQLIENRDLNNFTFHVEKSALSKRKLIQKGWDTLASDTLKEGYCWVNTITLNELTNKYKINFDTLILDCEGAFYYILLDMPQILNNIKLIIMENDYYDMSQKNYVDEILKKNNFYTDYVEVGGWGNCYNNFYEVWKKKM